jgi:hypothetical protein
MTFRVLVGDPSSEYSRDSLKNTPIRVRPTFIRVREIQMAHKGNLREIHAVRNVINSKREI